MTAPRDSAFGIIHRQQPAFIAHDQADQRQLGFDPTGAVGPVLWAKIVTQGAGY